MPPRRIFLLSPASCGGERARQIFASRADFDLARRVRSAKGAPLAEVFSYLSALYFRGKLEYARAYARPPRGLEGVWIITAGDGLLTAEKPATAALLEKFARVPIDAGEPLYRRPLARDTRKLAADLPTGCEVVLLGSIATGKYTDILAESFGHRLRIPGEFVGRGDMSRGGLMLRCVREGRELTYIPVNGTLRRGPRPPRLPARAR